MSLLLPDRICPRCAKSRTPIKVDRKDPTTGKYWAVVMCIQCQYGFDLWEVPGPAAEGLRKWKL